MYLLVSDLEFLRKATMEYVIHVIRLQPRLSKEASSVLVDLGETVQANATHNEISVLVQGSLSQETHVRSSCLQAIQVRLAELFGVTIPYLNILFSHLI